MHRKYQIKTWNQKSMQNVFIALEYFNLETTIIRFNKSIPSSQRKILVIKKRNTISLVYEFTIMCKDTTQEK